MCRVVPGDCATRAHPTMGGCVLTGTPLLSSEVGGASVRGREVGRAKSVAAGSFDEGGASMGGSWHVVAFGESLLVLVLQGVGGTELLLALLLQGLPQSTSLLQTNPKKWNVLILL